MCLRRPTLTQPLAVGNNGWGRLGLSVDKLRPNHLVKTNTYFSVGLVFGFVEYVPHSVGKARQGLPNPGYSAGFGNPAGANPRQVGHTCFIVLLLFATLPVILTSFYREEFLAHGSS